MKPKRIPDVASLAPEQGISLIVVLIMLVIIGLSAGSAMRNATSEQRAANNQRQEAGALQYAEAALRYCEGQMATPTVARVNTLQTASIPTTTVALSGWEHTPSWINSAGRASSSRTNVPDNIISTSGVTQLPTTSPQCVVESQALGTATVLVITARGFSLDYVADASGNTTNGAVVWLQSIVNANP